MKGEQSLELIFTEAVVDAEDATFLLGDSRGKVLRSEGEVVEQLIRPTGLLDPQVEVREATREPGRRQSETRPRRTRAGGVGQGLRRRQEVGAEPGALRPGLLELLDRIVQEARNRHGISKPTEG